MRIRESLRGRLSAVGVFVGIAAAIGLALPTTALADSQADNLQFIIVSDDIRKDTTSVARGAGTNGDGSGEEDGAGQGNHGHGNNEDGVDSSNPGEGDGGANAEGADSDPSVDDEAGGGGAAPSKGNNGKNK